MNKKQIALSLVLADFAAFTAYVIYQYGYFGFYQFAVSNGVAMQVSFDLVIALSLVLVWMWRDARARGLSPLPYVLVTLVLGSIGPLLYLVRRAGDERRQVAALAKAA